MRPILLSFAGLDVRSAPVFAGISALAAYLYMSRQRPRDLPEDDFWSLMLLFSIGVIGGGILLFLLIGGQGPAANLRLYLSRRSIPGGAFYGSLGACLAAAYAYCRARRLDFPALADRLGPASMLGLCIMRLGCFLNGCCAGSPTDLRWGVAFLDARCALRKDWLGVPLHPSQLYESAAASAVFLFSHFFALRRVREGRWKPGAAFASSAGLYAAGRFALDFLRGNEQPHFGLDANQWISLLVLAALAAVPWKNRLGG
jgi:phosphatidylglycerol:prolipoprotein diacylglycerol transferase